MREELFAGTNGLNLFSRTWKPAQPARGVVVIVHGFKSHSGLFAWTAEKLVEKGLAVYALDMRGHGKSEGERYFVERFADYTNDLHAFMQHTKAREPNLPIYLLGHGAGAVVSCLYALEHQHELAGLICESFDPLVDHEPGPTNTLTEMARAHERLEKQLGQLVLPLLILHGTTDEATKPCGSQDLFDNAGANDKTLTLYEGHVHDLLDDAGKEFVLADILEWVTTRLKA